MFQTEVWAALGTKYSSVLGKLQIKLLVSAVASVSSFLFLLITFVPPLLPTANCSISALKKNYFKDWIFSQGIYPDYAVHTFITADWKSPHPHILLWYQCLCPEGGKEIYKVKYRQFLLL